MKKAQMLEIVKALPFDKEHTVYEKGNLSIFLTRPSQVSGRFKSYDIKKNFQIWFKEADRKFRPNHLRVLIDLNLRVRSKPELKRQLLVAFDNIFYGSDPEGELRDLANHEFQHSLNPIMVTGILSQLLIIEQEYNYNRESNFDPPTLFYQGWVREFIDNPKEIDNLCMSVANGQPPSSKYVNLENKKNKKFVAGLKPLWYITESLQ